MRNRIRLTMVALVASLGLAGPAAAVEYRLNVVNLHEGAFASFLGGREWFDGAAGPGLNRLEASLDRGDVGKGNLLYDRHVHPAAEATARAWGATPVPVATVTMGGIERQLWDEIRWEGQPGEQSVWLVRPTSRLPQYLVRTAIKGAGPMRQFQPYAVPAGTRVPVLRMPLAYIVHREEDGSLWRRDVASRLDLGNGIGVVVGLNDNGTFPDSATIVVTQGAEPTTYKAVLVWRLRGTEQQAPGDGIRRINHR
jgi:hypothetical protein